MLGNDRFHRECIALADAAIAEHTLDPADVSGWPVNQRTAKYRPDDETEYRIDFTITRRQPGDDDFAEIGFGSSGAWPDVEQCAHMLDASRCRSGHDRGPWSAPGRAIFTGTTSRRRSSKRAKQTSWRSWIVTKDSSLQVRDLDRAICVVTGHQGPWPQALDVLAAVQARRGGILAELTAAAVGLAKRPGTSPLSCPPGPEAAASLYLSREPAAAVRGGRHPGAGHRGDCLMAEFVRPGRILRQAEGHR